ncbi:MAG TPA: IPTL-CTERM sorting domain-containing protein [Thermodesulfobacteriota bacterium]|nr:IPTL-CTERM sorting domain-containing protein [Thermodesulfobacteriota bacterium]
MSSDKSSYGIYPYLKLFIICFSFNAVFFLLSSDIAQSQLMENTDTPPAVSVPTDTLWDQSDNISSSDISSQDFTDGGGLDQFDSRAADDFLVPEGFFWIIDTVRVFGAFDDTPPDLIDSVDVDFYVDRDGLPGQLVAQCIYDDVLPDDLTNPEFTINLPHTCRLQPGIYWVSVRANISFIQNGQWFWFERTVQTLSPFVWQNPGNGFSTGCIQYTPAQADCGADFPDLVFQIIGREYAIVRPIPTLSEWGMIAAAVILGFAGLGAFYLRRKCSQA